MKIFFRAFLTISRAKIQVATIPHALLGVFLASETLQDIKNQYVLLYVILYFILITMACNINCLYDKDIDARYKTTLSYAIKTLGDKKVKSIIVSEIILAIIFIYLLYLEGFIFSSIFSLFGLLIGFVYSAKPLRLKGRGIISPIPVFVGLYMFPLFGGWFLIKDSLEVNFITFVIGYALINESLTLINTCEDYSEDQKEGIKTWAHIFGLKNTLRVSLIMIFSGSICVIAGLYKHLLSKIFAKQIIPIIFIILFLFGIIISFRDIMDSLKANDLFVSTREYAKKLPFWFIIVRYPLLFSVFFSIPLD